MQRYGPPPSYPNLKIPGLNAPIPEVCIFYNECLNFHSIITILLGKYRCTFIIQVLQRVLR